MSPSTPTTHNSRLPVSQFPSCSCNLPLSWHLQLLPIFLKLILAPISVSILKIVENEHLGLSRHQILFCQEWEVLRIFQGKKERHIEAEPTRTRGSQTTSRGTKTGSCEERRIRTDKGKKKISFKKARILHFSKKKTQQKRRREGKRGRRGEGKTCKC